METQMVHNKKTGILRAYQRNIKHSITYVGFTVDEKKRAEKLAKVKNLTYPFPLIEMGMTDEDILRETKLRGIPICSLYEKFARVSCWCCPLQRIGEIRSLRKDFPQQWKILLKWDKKIKNNRGFRGYKTVHDMERHFAGEDDNETIQS